MKPRKPGEKDEPGRKKSGEDQPDGRSPRERADALTSDRKPAGGQTDSKPTDSKPAAPKPAGHRATDHEPAGRRATAPEPKDRVKDREPTARKRSATSGSGSDRSGQPRLTEKQRIEARRRRRETKRRPVHGNVLSRGVRATAHEIQRTSLFIGRAILTGLDSLKPVGGIVVAWLGVALGAVGGVLRAIGQGISIAFRALGRAVLALDRIITPRRALLTLALFAAGLLAVSQFTDYRAIEIGQPGYVEIADITRAPQVDVKTPLDTHSILLLAVAVFALAATVATALTGRRRYAAAIALAGSGTLIVALAIDLPRGLDAAEAELSYAGVKAVLLSGFWLELASGMVLTVSGLCLLAAPAASRASAARSPRSRREPGTRQRAVAGGRA